jgi:hypothetical protein
MKGVFNKSVGWCTSENSIENKTLGAEYVRSVLFHGVGSQESTGRTSAMNPSISKYWYLFSLLSVNITALYTNEPAASHGVKKRCSRMSSLHYYFCTTAVSKST